MSRPVRRASSSRSSTRASTRPSPISQERSGPATTSSSRDGDATDPPGGHGTAVAGVAAARANNGFGGMGTCFSCDLMPLRVLGPDGIAFNTNTAAAIDYAVDHGAAVVNASIYGPHSPPTLRDAIVRARAAGVLVVAAAGNEGTTQEQFPAAFPEAISVGAAKGSTLAPYSSFGSWLEVRGARVRTRNGDRRRNGRRLRNVRREPPCRRDRGPSPRARALRERRRARECPRPHGSSHPGSPPWPRRCGGRSRRARQTGTEAATSHHRNSCRRPPAGGILGPLVRRRSEGELPVGAVP